PHPTLTPVPSTTLFRSADIVRYESDNQLPTSVDIVINRTGLLDLNGFTDNIGDMSLTGGAIQTGSGLLQLRGNLTAIGDLVSDRSEEHTSELQSRVDLV